MKLSIITVCYNDKLGLERTLQSVKAQTTRDFEMIVIDGGSSDGSYQVIRQYKDYLDYWVSEPDRGIFHAMNKGVALAHGLYCLFLNAGDTLYAPNTVSQFLDDEHKEDILTGNEIGCLNGIPQTVKYAPEQLNTLFFVRDSSFLAHQSTFIRTELLRKRPYDERYKLMADSIFFFFSFTDGATYKRLNFFVSLFDMSGASTQKNSLLMKEKKRFFENHFSPPIYQELLFYAYWDNLLWEIRKKTWIGKIALLLKKWSWFMGNISMKRKSKKILRNSPLT